MLKSEVWEDIKYINHFLQPTHVENRLSLPNMPNLTAEGFQQQQYTLPLWMLPHPSSEAERLQSHDCEPFVSTHTFHTKLQTAASEHVMPLAARVHTNQECHTFQKAASPMDKVAV